MRGNGKAAAGLHRSTRPVMGRTVRRPGIGNNRSSAAAAGSGMGVSGGVVGSRARGGCTPSALRVVCVPP